MREGEVVWTGVSPGEGISGLVSGGGEWRR